MPVKEKKEKLYSIGELAAILGITHEAVRLRVKENNLPSNIEMVHKGSRIFLKYKKPL